MLGNRKNDQNLSLMNRFVYSTNVDGGIILGNVGFQSWVFQMQPSNFCVPKNGIFCTFFWN